MRIILAGGGTGGGVYPALAVAEALEAHDPQIELRFVGSQREVERETLVLFLNLLD